MTAKSRTKPRKTYTMVGYWAAKRAVMRFGFHAIDGRSRVGRGLAVLRAELERDLGGAEALSRQQSILIDLAARTHFLLTGLDNYIFSMESPVNKRRRAVYPVLRERTQLADALARYLGQLGLERVPKSLPSLEEYLARPTERDEETTEALAPEESQP